jgi:hypothetical protein
MKEEQEDAPATDASATVAESTAERRTLIPGQLKALFRFKRNFEAGYPELI